MELAYSIVCDSEAPQSFCFSKLDPTEVILIFPHCYYCFKIAYNGSIMYSSISALRNSHSVKKTCFRSGSSSMVTVQRRKSDDIIVQQNRVRFPTNRLLLDFFWRLLLSLFRTCSDHRCSFRGRRHTLCAHRRILGRPRLSCLSDSAHCFLSKLRIAREALQRCLSFASTNAHS